MEQMSQENFERIERYLSGELSQDEYQSFSAKIESDPVLKDEVNKTRLFMLGIKQAALQEKMNMFHNDLKSSGKVAMVKPLFKRNAWLAAASIIIIAFLITFFIVNKNNSQDKLFAGYYEPDPGLITAMGISEDYEFNRGMVDYKTGNYKNALERWEKLAEQKPNSDTLNYFIGSALLASGESKKSIPYFEKVLKRNGGYFRSDANWYLGLALLKEGKKEEAKAKLESSDHPGRRELLSEFQ